MKGVWDALSELTIEGDGAGWVVWLGHARMAANLMIVAASVFIARVLSALHPRKSAGPHARRKVEPITGLTIVFGVSLLAVLLVGKVSSQGVLTVMKVVAAASWVVTAVRLFPVAARLKTTPTAEAMGLPAPARDAAPALADERERLTLRARTLEYMVRNETWLLDETDALREVQDILADLEAVPCKI